EGRVVAGHTGDVACDHYHRLGGVRYAGRRLLPDVDETCAEVAGAITPRVGGVGPTTVAMLFRNAVAAAERQVG
ncbi:hypothetical protein ACWD50_32640, partial [Micromonospora sp. NPDC005113]